MSNKPNNLQDASASVCKTLIRDGALVLVDFWSPACGPCRSLMPVLEELAGCHPELSVVKVNIENNGTFADELNVQSVPSLLLFKAGECVDRLVGKVPYVSLESAVARLYIDSEAPH